MPPSCCLSKSQREAVQSPSLHHNSWHSWRMLGLLVFSCSPGISPAQLKLLSWMVQVMKKIRHTWKEKLQMKAKTAKHKCLLKKKKKTEKKRPPHHTGKQHSQACQLSLTPSDIKLPALFTYTKISPSRILQMINFNVLASSFIPSNSFKCPKSQGEHPSTD